MKAIEQYVHVVMFIMLPKVVLTSKFVDQTLMCRGDHSDGSYWAVLSCGTVKLKCATISMKAYEKYPLLVLFLL